MKKKFALSVAGSDPSGGAGIQADIKVFSSLGLHGLTVITCITSQNTKKVKEIFKLPINIIENQFECLIEEGLIDFVKTGMLYDSEIVELIVNKIKKYNLRCIVDPIMYASSGGALSTPNFIDALKNKLFPHTFIVTPNLYEAQVLSDKKIKNLKDIKEACKIISDMGPKFVLITGGHLKGEFSKDVLFNGKKYTLFSLPKIHNKQFHGTGCTFSSLITGLLILGYPPKKSIEKAKNILWNMIYYNYKINEGPNIVNISSRIVNETCNSFSTYNHFKTWFELKEFVDSILSKIPLKFIPEVGINVGYALTNAKTQNEICAINGRIIKTSIGAQRYGALCFGPSKHISSIILAAMKFDPKYRCAINIKYSLENLKNCKKTGFLIGSFDRENEPSNILSTMDWGTHEIISNLDKIPDIIYDTGKRGKEPMIRILATNPKNLFKKFNTILKNTK